MDPRYKNATIFDRRKREWNPDDVKDHIDQLFQKISLLEGWSFSSSSWIKVAKHKKEELKKHSLKILNVKIKNRRDEEIGYNIQVPQLLHDQFFYIGGYLKIPMFQLYDAPVIFRKELLKLRTNTISINMNLKKGYNVNIFNKMIPIDLLICTVHTQEEVESFFTPMLTNPTIAAIYDRCLESYDSFTRDEMILKLGDYFSTNPGDQVKKGEGVVFSIKTSYEVDTFIHSLFETNSILFEIIKSLFDGIRSDTDVGGKRIRFTEYILSPLVKKIYDMLLTLKNNPRVKFQIPQTILFDSANKSDIVRFSFPVNPVSEIAQMCQCTLTGPGGFKKDNVPGHLRNLHESQFGKICPADTPDRSGCGVTLNMIPVIDLDDSGKFASSNNDIVTSYPIALTPFLEHDDQTRLQMASNQAKQSILLKNSQIPYIKSGVEKCYHDHGTFMEVAKQDGKVIHLSKAIMMVAYEDETIEIFSIGFRSIFQGVLDIIKPKFLNDRKFKKGDIICESHFLKDGELSLGQNLLTAIGIWEGFNYEDGLVISRSVAESKFTSIHHVDLTFQIDPSQVLLSLMDDKYHPLPIIGQKLTRGEPYAKLKTIDSDEGFESINMEPNELTSPIDCEIVGTEIYPNFWNKQVKEYDTFIQESLSNQSEEHAIIESKLYNYMDKDNVDKYMSKSGLSKTDCVGKKGSYSFKGQKLNGIMITIKAIYEEPIGIGDKIANRHGNKGVIALIEEDENMPTLPDGRKAEIIINPLGIISRMNAGQLFEVHSNEALYQLKQQLHEMTTQDSDDPDYIKNHLKGFLNLIDKTDDKWVTKIIFNEFVKNIKISYKHAIDNLYMIQPPFQSIGPEELDVLLNYTGAKYKYEMYHPAGKVNIKQPLTAGYMYFNKLIHRASDKMSARSIGPYSKKTLQPLGGKSKQGGHRLGEMEVWAVMAHGANDLLKNFLTVQSDSPGLKNKLLAEVLNNPELAGLEDTDERPQSLRLFDAYLKILTLEMDDEDGENSE